MGKTSIFTVHDGSWHRLIKKLQLRKKTSRVIRTFYFHSHLNCKRFHKSFIQNAGCWKAHSQILWTLLRSWTFGLQTYCCGKMFGNSPTSNHRCCKSQKSKKEKAMNKKAVQSSSFVQNMFRGIIQTEQTFPYPKVLNEEQAENLGMLVEPTEKF